ncbi:craniofacial development protein 2-like [Procambarus clarkii]|uniref:craniofacial development protein 2-like n=1 Tax=Procambarus clarkii TaxID=6728 RepID=UPI003742D61C
MHQAKEKQTQSHPALKLGTWNVGTMTPGLSEDLLEGKPSEEVREHGVGFAVRNRLLGSIVPPTEGSAKIIKLQLHTAAGMVSLINAYTPTLTSSTETKVYFYDDLGLTLRDIPQQEPVFFLEDINARVGSDHSSCLGPFGFRKMNESGQLLLEFCCRYDLCVNNSFFDTKPQHKVSWRHPRSKHWHQLDLVLTERSNLRSIKLTRSFQSTDVTPTTLSSFAK